MGHNLHSHGATRISRLHDEGDRLDQDDEQ